jgi:hypothetical protein
MYVERETNRKKMKTQKQLRNFFSCLAACSCFSSAKRETLFGFIMKHMKKRDDNGTITNQSRIFSSSFPVMCRKDNALLRHYNNNGQTPCPKTYACLRCGQNWREITFIYIKISSKNSNLRKKCFFLLKTFILVVSSSTRRTVARKMRIENANQKMQLCVWFSEEFVWNNKKLNKIIISI